MESLTLLFLSPLFLGFMVWEYRKLRGLEGKDYSFREIFCNFSLAGLHQALMS